MQVECQLVQVVAPREVGRPRCVSIEEGRPVEGVKGGDRALTQEHHLLPVKSRVTLNIAFEADRFLGDAAMHRAPGNALSEFFIRVDKVCLREY